MLAYYNEIDPYAAQWLRNLIAGGHIAPGDVDERSIADVRPEDLRGYGQCHFFAGIGGWPYALRLAGWPDDRPVWTGSCPCQPFSAAGRQRGGEDERHLWPAWFRLLRECRPATVFGEQVSGASGLAWLDHVCADLEDEGYAVGAADIPAAGVGAWHVRARLWWAATNSNANCVRLQRKWKIEVGTWDKQQFTRLVQDQLKYAIPAGRMHALSDGIPNRVGRLRAYGNAIVPQVAAQFIGAYMETAHARPASLP